MATIRKRTWATPSGAVRTAWIVSYSAGKKRHIRTFHDKRSAEQWRAETIVEIKDGKHVPRSASVTVAKAAARWLEQCATDGLEAATRAQYEQHVRLHILPLLGAHKLAELNSAAIDDFRNLLIAKQGKSRTLVAKVMTSLGAILATAQRAGWASHNVVRDQARLAGTRQRKLDKRHDKRLEVGIDIPTKGELRGILRAAESMNGRARALLVFTGLRASELRGLRWQDVDLAVGALTMRQRADRYNEIGSPKSEAGQRRIPLPSNVVNMLKEWRLACPKGSLDLVFPTRSGTVEQLHVLTGEVKAVQVAAGLKGVGRKPKYGLHSFRHAAASLFIDLGLSPKRVQTLMGHSSIVITLNTYTHLFPNAEEDTDAMRRLQLALG